jgi:hypothetical protein
VEEFSYLAVKNMPHHTMYALSFNHPFPQYGNPESRVN